MKAIHVALAGLILLCMSAGKATGADDLKNKVKGKWDVVIPDAPPGYQNYTLNIKEKDKKIVIDVKGGEIDIKEQAFAEKDGKLSANLYVSEYVKVTIWEEEGVVKGSANTSMGPLTLNFKKAGKKSEVK